MLILLSPAKNVNEARAVGHATTDPVFLNEASELACVARDWSEEEIAQIMKVSSALAKLNRDRYRHWTSDGDCAAGLLFDGDVYKELDFGTFEDTARHDAGRRLRILSGLYGLLRPTDAIRPYRFEMGRKCPGHPSGTLYKFWGQKIAQRIVEDAHDIGTTSILNLASEEYSKAVDRTALEDLDVVSPRFEEERAGKRKVIGISAKRARGAMARWVLHADISDPRDIETFDVGGYTFDADASDPYRPVFVRS